MTASEHLSTHQFIGLDKIEHAPIPHESLMDEDWAAEHTNEYAHHGGSAGYVAHLAASLVERGQDKAVALKHNGDGTYRIDDGNHRVAAAHLAGLSHVHALIHPEHPSESNR